MVLLDIEMPGLAGADALIAIQAVAPAVKVIMVSGTSDAALAQRTLAERRYGVERRRRDITRELQSSGWALVRRPVK